MNIEYKIIKTTDLKIKDTKDISNILIEHIDTEYVKVYPKDVLIDFKKNGHFSNIINRFSDNRVTYYATINGEIIGMLSLLNNELRTFHVSNKYRGKGIGKELLKNIIHENGNNKLKVKALLSAISIYEKLGFQKHSIEDVNTAEGNATYQVQIMYLETK